MPFTDSPRLQGWLEHPLLDTDRDQRLRVFRTLMAAAVYCACALGAVLNVVFCFGDRVETLWSDVKGFEGIFYAI